jgi:hypothetical protein
VPATVAAPFPRSAAEITSDWLAGALREAGVLTRHELVSVDVRPAAAGLGFMGCHARLTLRYSGRSPGAPRSVFAKMSSVDPAVRAALHDRRFYEREVHFYRDAAPQVRLRTPRCYFAAIDMESGHSLLLLEDLCDARPGDVLAGCPTAEALRLLRSMAGFHAQWWQASGLARWAWLPSADQESPATYAERVRRCWEPFMRKFAAVAPARLIGLCQRALRHPVEIRAAVAACPETLAHGDFQLGNTLFDAHGEACLVDWHAVTRVAGVRDVGWFLVLSLPVSQRRRDEDALLRAYHESLVEAGVRGYTLATLREQLRLVFRYDILRLVGSLAVLDFSGDRGRLVAAALIERAAAVLDDHDIEKTLA